MQDLIVGERYYVRHKRGTWEGEVTFNGFVEDLLNGRMLSIKDIKVTGGDSFESSFRYFRDKGNKSNIGGAPEWWGFEPVNFSLENE